MRTWVLFNIVAAVLAAPKDLANVGKQQYTAVSPVAQLAHVPQVAPTVYSGGAIINPVLSGYRHVSLQPHSAKVAQPVHVVSTQAVAHAQPVPVVSQNTAHVQLKAVNLAPRQVNVPITQAHVEVPIHQQVNYGLQQYVAGHATRVDKPSIVAPKIQAPAVFKQKVTQTAPQVTFKRQEIPVVQNVPEYVEKPYYAGQIVQYTEPKVQEIAVPTPFKVQVQQEVPVQYAVPVVTQQEVAVAAPVLQPTVYQGSQLYSQGSAVPITYGAAHLNYGTVVAPQQYTVEQNLPTQIFAGHGFVAGQSLVNNQGLVSVPYSNTQILPAVPQNLPFSDTQVETQDVNSSSSGVITA